MGVRNKVRLIIYRINKKGLEIFLVNSEGNWQFPEGDSAKKSDNPLWQEEEGFIELDPIRLRDGETGYAWAVEGDWHTIPSIRSMIKEDVRIVKSQLKQRIPELEHGAFFAVKEALKKVMPDEYASLKELKDIIFDRNQVKYI